MSCSVCCDEAATFLTNLSSCAHNGDVCVPCHRSFVTTTRAFVLVDNAVAAVPCMSKGCSGTYSADALQRLLPTRERAAVFERLATRCFEQMANHVVCSRPQCGALLTFESACRSVVCARCANAMCLACGRDAHDDLSCDDYEATVASGWSSEKLINAISRRCPKCLFRVQRVGGCPHMTCSQCNAQFCYGCLGDRSQYRAGAHDGCDRVASQFEQDGLRLLKQLKDEDKLRLRAAATAARAARREAALRERAIRRANGEQVVDDEDEDENLGDFNPWAVFEAIGAAQPASLAPPAPPAADADMSLDLFGEFAATPDVAQHVTDAEEQHQDEQLRGALGLFGSFVSAVHRRLLSMSA